MVFGCNFTFMKSAHININLNFQQIKDVVSQLSPKEKSALNEYICAEDMEIPASQQKLVLDRIAKSTKDPSRMLNWDEAPKSLKS